ncbi:Rrf2 family transcriptional regulator [Mariprofundus ferrooxydans]|nr:Rrf2 family transcriptional regulator [Mariprofundus ferrooxydans]
MQLTRYTDYSLRVLFFLAAHPGERCTISQISEYFNVSRNHMVKVVHNLGQLGFIHTIRGKSGGMTLAMQAADINIADVVKRVEPHMNLLECFDKPTNTCPIIAQCGLKGVLYKARKGFMAVLAEYTVADLLPADGLPETPPSIGIEIKIE